MQISQDYYDQLMDKLPGVEVAYNDAGNLAEEFLKGTYRAMTEKKNVDNEIVKLEVLMDTSFSKAVESAEGSKITEKKEAAKLDTDYIRSKVKYGEAKNLSDFLRHCIKLFENAHIFYRGIYRGKFGD
jgi:hypothetical protein